jgi:acyl carrier protein
MAEASRIQESVKSYLLEEFLPGEDPSMLKDDTPLISTGILDSIATLKLISFLEDEFKIQFEAHESSADYLDTIADITRLVQSKQGK